MAAAANGKGPPWHLNHLKGRLERLLRRIRLGAGGGESPEGRHDAISSTLIHFCHRVSLERHTNDTSVLYYSMAAVWGRFDSAAGR